MGKKITITRADGTVEVVHVSDGLAGDVAAFAARARSRAKLEGGRWITVGGRKSTSGTSATATRRSTARAKAGTSKSKARTGSTGGMRLYIKGAGGKAARGKARGTVVVIAGAGATKSRPKTLGQVVEGLKQRRAAAKDGKAKAAGKPSRPRAEPKAKAEPKAEPKARFTPAPKAEPKPTALSEHGPSRAKVTHHDYSEKEVLGEARAVFGRDVTTRDIASAVGAPHDASVNVAPTGDGGLRVLVTGTGYRANRTITTDVKGRTVIDNAEFYVEPGHQGKGIGANVFGRQVEQASKLGVDRIVTYGAGTKDSDYNGYSTWPKFGYDAELGPSLAAYIKSGKAPPLPASVKNPTRISDFMKTPEGRQWWADNGQGQEMNFDLKAGSYSRNQWDAYRREKAARAG